MTCPYCADNPHPCPECVASRGDPDAGIDDMTVWPENVSADGGLEYATTDPDGQRTLDRECERCGRETDSVEEYDGAMLCLTCRDAREEGIA